VAPALTPSQTVGPFFSFGLCDLPRSDLVEAGSEGAIRIEGVVLDGEDAPVDDALVEIWQADETGRYRGDFGWGRAGTDREGRFSFVTVKPGAVADGDGTRQAPHLTVLVFARGLLKPVHTRIYFPDESDANAADPILSAIPEELRSSLVAEGGPETYRLDVRLQGERETPFFAR
jgi:protocatechuate 3,4-dioxygenase, alpha subunit